MLAPAADAYVRFPNDFGRRSLVLVDTEEEFDWSAPKRRDATSVRSVASLPKAQALLRDHGHTPVYLVDYPVATTPESVEVLGGFLRDGACEIGSQLHPWVNPPFDEIGGDAVGRVVSFPGNLPRQLERAKLGALTDAIHANFGVRSIVYRAGRYGIGPNTEAVLSELGYRVDVSVRPLFDYGDEGGPNFKNVRAQPFWIDPHHTLLEVPLTSAFIGALRAVGEPLFRATGHVPRARGLMARAGLMNRVALTPEGIPLAEAIEALRVMLDGGTQLVSISFHSPSVEPGHTPYVRDAADLRRFYGWFDGVLGFLERQGVKPATVAEVLAAAERAG